MTYSATELEESCSPEVRKFLRALVALCVEHDVSISATRYDGLQVWPLDSTGDTICFPYVEDCTKGSE